MTERSDIKHVGVWLRVSTDEQAKGESPEHHRKRAEMFAELKGWKVIEIYDLCGVSGKAVMEHPECKRLYHDISRGRITGLIFSKLARLARNTRDLLDIAEYFDKHDADLISLQESIDTSSPAGRLFFTVIAALTQFEREEIADRVRASVPVRAKLGKNIGGQASFGYRWVNKQLVPDPNEAPIRRRIYELFLEHRRRRTVARILNEEGHRTRNGSKWTDTTIHRLLKDPTAKGLHVANKTTSAGRGKAAASKPESEWVARSVEAIVPEELWERCNALIGDGESGRKVTRGSKHLLSGKVYCACGAKMYPRSKSPAYVCKQPGCKSKVQIDDLDAIFREHLQSFVFSDEEIAAHFGDASDHLKQRENERQVLAREKQKLEHEMDGIYRLYIDGGLDTDGFARKNRPLEERLRQIEATLPELEGEIDLLRSDFLNREEIVAEARTLSGHWSELPFTEQRAIVETIVDRITVKNGEIDLNLLYLPNEKSANSATRNHGFIAATSWMRDG